MIVALEGPDGAGKTTLYQALRGVIDATFVPSFKLPLSIPACACGSMIALEALDLWMWGNLYDRSLLYVCDRHASVSGPVYARRFRRPIPDASPWYNEVKVLFMRDRAEDRELLALYDAHVPRFAFAIVSSVCEAERCIMRWKHVEDRAQHHERRAARMRDTRGKYVADLGRTVDTPCILLPKKHGGKLVAAARRANGRQPKDAVACHRCDRPLCIRGDHLFWGTSSDNMHDMVLKGRGANTAEDLRTRHLAHAERCRAKPMLAAIQAASLLSADDQSSLIAYLQQTGSRDRVSNE